ncbi:hypothetical protein DEU56DRAFT_827697 [Suillus clintonianus]|uniref:uncharacterized protein n=1 Tax=Suillus clintonianus TaxID=1904413 RepID=UPI001B8654A9|nr:uncharacterized protein DEU56DRAFT_827697 [Suillus clintonianus]KAG2124212.1 hypothetical protein DEU56DRAFT_827697 [Suillus clintonianus]
MAARFASDTLELALLLCSVCSLVVVVENVQDSLVVRVNNTSEQRHKRVYVFSCQSAVFLTMSDYSLESRTYSQNT